MRLNGKCDNRERPESPLVAVIIVGFRSARFYPSCLKAIQEQTFRQFQVIVINNSPEEDIEAIIRPIAPSAIIRTPQCNTGYAGGNNIGLRLAQGMGALFAILVNPDVSLAPDCLEQLVAYALSAPVPCLLQPILRYPNGKIQTAGNLFHFLGFCSCNNKLPLNHTDEAISIAYPSGAAMFIDLRICQDIGLLNEDLFCYQEDLEFALRARLAGYPSFLIPRAGGIHDYEFTGRSPEKFLLLERNRWYILGAFYPSRILLLLFPLLLMAEMVVLLWSAKNGCITQKIHSYFAALSLLPRIRGHRRLLRHRYPNPESALLAIASWQLNFPHSGHFLGMANFCSRVLYEGLRWLFQTFTLKEERTHNAGL